MEKPKRDLTDHIVAVGSGKGGVGKSTTSVNLAVLAAREGLRTAIVDVDPLSDVSVIFDLPPDRLERARSGIVENKHESKASIRIEDFTVNVFDRLDLLFPHTKLGKGESSALSVLLFEYFPEALLARYDLIILDMPAGIGQDENLAYFPHLKHLMVVTNSEPTSHVSAGGYVKAALEINAHLNIWLWHNKFETATDIQFNPRTLFENYNSYVPEDLKLDERNRSQMRDLAFVPSDPSLDLLRADAEYHNHLLAKFLEVLRLLEEQAVAELPEASEVPKGLRVIIRHHVLHYRKDLHYGDCLSYIRTILGNPDFEFPLDQKIFIEKYLLVQKNHPLRRKIDMVRASVQRLIDRLASDGSMFSIRLAGKNDETARFRTDLTSRIKELLVFLAYYQSVPMKGRRPWPLSADGMIRNIGGLLFFYYALHRLSEHASVQALLTAFVPHRKTKDGRRYRDRYRQIAMIITKDDEYHRRYFELIKRLFPVIQKQMISLSGNPAFSSLLWVDTSGKPKHNAYLKLLSRTIHDMVNGGLGIYVGVKYNVAASAILEGGRKLLVQLGMIQKPAKKSVSGRIA